MQRKRTLSDLGLTRVEAGVYKHTSGWFILRTFDVYEGPRGGSYNGWEYAYYREREGYTIDSWTVFPTLREAAQQMPDREPPR